VPVVCPKCGHARAPAESAPAWQCPVCGIAYHKYQGYLERARRAVTPLQADDPVPRWSADGSVWSLLGANALVVVAALYLDWSATSLMLVYWSQSVVIGISYFFRILSLEKFSTENFRINNRPVDPTPATKIQVAGFFAMHYGFFHVVYFVFLIADPEDTVSLDAAFWLCAAAFALNHFWSYRYNRDLDRQGTPNIGTLMFTPYLRIVPMHFTIILGGMLIYSAATLLLFGGLKTLADAGMHLAEHGRLRKVQVRIGGISDGT
jgi:hypothetical protein